jgi:hypothetical protein
VSDRQAAAAAREDGEREEQELGAEDAAEPCTPPHSSKRYEVVDMQLGPQAATQRHRTAGYYRFEGGDEATRQRLTPHSRPLTTGLSSRQVLQAAGREPGHAGEQGWRVRVARVGGQHATTGG